jgi:hypothetical protein
MPKALLSAQLLHVAAQFASPDPAKQLLTGILIRPADGGGVKIDSTDGIRAFSVICPDENWSCETPMLLSAKAFKKRISYAQMAQFIDTDEGSARILGGKHAKGVTAATLFDGPAFMQSFPALWQPAFAFEGDPAEQYPKIDQLWPDQFGRDTDIPITFNAALLADFLIEVNRYSGTGRVVMQRNSPTNPMVFSSTMSGTWLDEVEIRFLLMPIQIAN